MAFEFDMEKNKEKVAAYQEFLNNQKGKAGNTMIALHEAQHVFGYIPEEIQQMISDTLRVPMAEIYGVITFYGQFTLEPKGEMQVGVCLGTACYVKGAPKILEKFEEEMGIKAGTTKEDGSCSLTATRCLGACGLAPVAHINDKVVGHLTASDVPKVISAYYKERETNA